MFSIVNDPIKFDHLILVIGSLHMTAAGEERLLNQSLKFSRSIYLLIELHYLHVYPIPNSLAFLTVMNAKLTAVGQSSLLPIYTDHQASSLIAFLMLSFNTSCKTVVVNAISLS